MGVASIHLCIGSNLSIVEENRVTDRLECRAWVIEVHDKVIVVLDAVVASTLQVRDGLDLAGLGFHHGGPTSCGIQFKDALVELEVENALHLHIEGGIDIGAIDRLSLDDGLSIEFHLLSETDARFAIEQAVEGLLQTIASVTFHVAAYTIHDTESVGGEHTADG